MNNNISDKTVSIQKSRAKRKPTKEELIELMKIRNKIIASKGKYFKAVSQSAYDEWNDFNICDKCKFVGKTCHKTCGVLIKHLHKIGAIELAESFGNSRVSSEAEFTDTMAVNPGLEDSVDQSIADEANAEDIEFLDQFEYEDQDNG